MSSGAKISNNSFSLSWEQAAITYQRERAAEGMILGVAIAESLAIPRNGVSKWTGLRVFGRSPLRFQFVPGLALPGEHTHALLMTMQAIFQSRADHRLFGKSLKKRVGLYRSARPLSHAKALLKPRLLMASQASDYKGLMGNPLVRAAAISLMVQGAAHAKSWVEQSSQCTLQGERNQGPAMLIAQAMQIAQLSEADEVNGQLVLQCLIENSDYPNLKSQLEVLAGYLAKRYSVAKVAKLLGYPNGIPRKLDAIALMSVYAWVRHFHRFRLAVERSSLLGGECAAVASLAGALSGASLGKKLIPPEWRTSLRMYPYNREWIQTVIARIKDWPHGVEDIQAARSEPSHPIGQMVRNLAIGCFQAVHSTIRIPTMVLPQKRARRPRP